MKKFREKMAEKSGFTLVELIVVIAILGILAAVAVPAYSGYVKKANEAADYAQLDAIKTAAFVVVTEKSVAKPETIKTIEVAPNSVKYTSDVATTGEEISTSIATYYDIANFKFKSGAVSAKWDASQEKWELIQAGK